MIEPPKQHLPDRRSLGHAILPRWVRVLRAAPLGVRVACLRAVDRAYLGLQFGFKMMGLILPFEVIPEAEVNGVRCAQWGERQASTGPTLPTLRVPLPPEATLRVTFNSIFSRGALWMSSASPEEVSSFVRQTLGKDWELLPTRGGARLILGQSGTGAEVAVSASRAGGAMIVIRQSPPRPDQALIHLRPVSERLPGGPGGALPKPAISPPTVPATVVRPPPP